jgi:hypothetical protein
MQGVTLTTSQRAQFLRTLAETANVTASAEATNMSRVTFYRLRAEDEEFATEWDEALEIATDALEAEARRRAMRGVSRPLVSAGKIVKDDDGNPIIVHEFSDTLMLAQLKAHRPDKYRERTAIEHTGAKGGPIAFETIRRIIVDPNVKADD